MKKYLNHIILALAMTFAIVFLAGNSFVSSAATEATLYKGEKFNEVIKDLAIGHPSASYMCYDVKNIVFTTNTKNTLPTIKKFPNKPIGNKVTAYYDSKNGIAYIYAATQIKFNSDCSYMFMNFYGLDAISYESKSAISTKNVSNMEYMFDSCYDLTDFNASIFNGIKPTCVKGMFRECFELKTVDLSGLDLSAIEDFSSMFLKCKRLENVLWAKFDTSRITNMRSMFNECCALRKMPFPAWFEAKNLTDMQYMFEDCTMLESVNFGNLQTQNVTDMSYMFRNCTSLKTVDLSKLNAKSLKEMDGMFYGCSGLETVSLKNLKAPELDSISSMFYGCSSLKSVDFTGFNPGKLDWVNRMFYGCRSIEAINLKDLDFTKVTDDVNYTDVFHQCDNLKVLISPKNINRAIPLKASFVLDDNGDGKADNTRVYKAIPISKTSHRYVRVADQKNIGDYSGSEENNTPAGKVVATNSTVSVGDNTFIINGDGSATVTTIGASGKVVINEVYALGANHPVTKIADNAAKDNKKIKSLTIGSNVTSIGKNAFKGCNKLKSVTIKANKKLKIGKGAFKKLSKGATIKIKGRKGNAKKKVVKALSKQTNAKVK